MSDEYETLKKELFSAKLFKKIKSIKEGEFPKLFKYEANKRTEAQNKDYMKIPKEQIAAFEKIKKEANEFKLQRVTGGRAVRKTLEKKVKLTGIDEILAIRQELKNTKSADEPEKERCSKRKKDYTSATDKIRQGRMRAWVDRCYDVVHGIRSRLDNPDVQIGLEPDIRELLEWDRLPLGLVKDNLHSDKDIREEDSSGSLDMEPSSGADKHSSSDETEKILRVKAGAQKPPIEEEDKKDYESESEVEIQTKSGVNFVLSDYFIQNLQELKSLAFNEELYAFHPERGIVGSWSVDAKICETDHKRLNVQFEGLLVDGSSNYAMYTAGFVDRKFNPISEFRVEQITKPKDTRSRSLFFHKKQSKKWLFDLREGVNETETRKTLTQNYQQMLRVLSEGAHILLMRKIVMYHHPFRIEAKPNEFLEHGKNDFCPCRPLSATCTCKWSESPFSLKTRFKLKMRSLCIGGDICRTNYRFYKPVRVSYNGVELEVVRIRRRIEMPGNLVQVSNYYMTTAGQLMGITFNDPYPFDTPYWLQVDPKAVLNRHRIVSPERIVPLRERYMCDPELKQFYEDEVERLMIVNRTYIRDHPSLRNALKAIFQDLLNDKPHRVIAFIQDFFFEGYRFKESVDYYRLPPDRENYSYSEKQKSQQKKRRPSCRR